MKVSVIVPVFNEGSTLGEALEALRRMDPPHEVIIVDGGSTDETVSLVRSPEVLVRSAKGRACQQNAGAGASSGDIFIFLHADTRLPTGGVSRVREVVARGAQGGRFRLRFDCDGWRFRFLEFYARFHCFSYGDQAFFTTRETFQALGGFREDVPFEDIDFYKRLRRFVKPVIIKEPVRTSARRFQGMGFWRQKMINGVLVFLHSAGFDVSGLKRRWYPEIR